MIERIPGFRPLLVPAIACLVAVSAHASPVLLEVAKGWNAGGDATAQSEEDELVLKSSSGGTLRSRRDYRDFTIRFRYRLEKGSAGLRFGPAPARERASDETGAALVSLDGGDPDRWHRFELTVRGGQALAVRDGVDIARIDSLPGEPGTLKFSLDPEAGPASLRLRELELLEYGEMERLTSRVRDAGCEEAFEGGFVRISLSHARELPDGNFEPLFHYGFLRGEAVDRSQARVFLLDGFESEVVAAPPGRDPRRNPGVSWQAASLRDHGLRWLETPWTASSHSRLDRPPQGHSRTLDPASYAVILATALRQNGEWDLAEALFDKAFRFQAKNPRERDLRLYQAHLVESLAAVRF